MNHEAPLSGIVCRRQFDADCFTGTAEDLVAAGLVRIDQLPGQPGNGSTTASFRGDGSRVRKGMFAECRAAGYLRIRKVSRRLISVERGVGEEEHRRRRQEWVDTRERERQERVELARSWPFPIVCGRPV